VNPGGTCELANPFNKQATLDVDFEDNISNNSGIFTYSLESSVGTFLLVQIDSDTDGIGGTTSVTKEVFGAYDPGTDTFSNLIGTETSTNGSTQIITLTNQNLPKIYIRDTYSASGSTRLDNITNSYLVPGPLPLLGAGAAFGFSRKLRGRIKATSNAWASAASFVVGSSTLKPLPLVGALSLGLDGGWLEAPPENKL